MWENHVKVQVPPLCLGLFFLEVWIFVFYQKCRWSFYQPVKKKLQLVTALFALLEVIDVCFVLDDQASRLLWGDGWNLERQKAIHLAFAPFLWPLICFFIKLLTRAGNLLCVQGLCVESHAHRHPTCNKKIWRGLLGSSSKKLLAVPMWQLQKANVPL